MDALVAEVSTALGLDPFVVTERAE